MVIWQRFFSLLRPQLWFEWIWGEQCHRPDESSYYIGRDSCAKCNRFISWHSGRSGLCSYHNVTWTNSCDRTSPYQLFKGSFEMWLRSRCGGDMDEAQIATDLLTLSSYLDYAVTRSQASGNSYDFCDEVFCDYHLVYDFLMDMRLQAKEPHSDSDRHPISTELRICEGLHHFIEFRKFQLPIKGIIENRYSATERLLESYKVMVIAERCHEVLVSIPIAYDDVDTTVHHFTPQYQIIVDFFKQCDNVKSIENGCDLDFATSFVVTYLYMLMPNHMDVVHLVRVRDIFPGDDCDVEYSSSRLLDTELSRYVSCLDLPSPVIASACIGKLQKSMALDDEVRAIVESYVKYIRPRLSRSNDYLLLDQSALGLTADDVRRRITNLVYRVTGKVTELVDRFNSPLPMTSTPKTGRASSRKGKSAPKKVHFGKVITKKYIKRMRGSRKRKRKTLVLDLSQIGV